MPCNKDTCGNYTPAGDGSGENCASPCGVTFEKKIWPVWDTKRINAPKWYRDRIMYYYDDVCERSQVHSISGTSPTIPKDTSGTQVEYGLSGVENPNAGRVRKALTGGFWWQGNGLLCPPSIYRGSGQSTGSASPCRYWDHYPAEISFEPIRSDSWFSYIYDTSKGVTGKPCYVYCYYTYTNTTSYANGKGTTTGYNTYYGIRKVPYTCNCDPGESYVNYSLEDGKITAEDEVDPYPLIWSVGTKQQRIAFSYSGAQINTTSTTVGGIYFRSTVKWTGNAGFFVAGTNYSNWEGPWVKVIDYQTGKTGTEIFNFRGTAGSGGGLFNLKRYAAAQSAQAESHRYTADMIVVAKWKPGFLFQEPQSAPIAYINATWRPSDRDLPGVGGSGYGALYSKLIINSIRLANNSEPLQPGVEYDVWVPREPGIESRSTYRYFLCGHVKFEGETQTIPTTSVKKSVPTTFHMGEPVAVSGSSGASLESIGFYEVWNGSRNSSYMSSQGKFWKSRNAKVTQDFSLPNGTIIRCEISSYYDDVASKYYTRWKILNVIRYGSDYVPGDGSIYSGQNVYYLYYPSMVDPDRVGIALMISGTADGDWSQGVTKIAEGDIINGWIVDSVKHSDEEFNVHVAYLKDGQNDFTKDTTYTSSSGINVNVKAGWGIKDRAAIIGRYEFQRKEIVYVTANANEDVPQEDLDVVKPQLQAVVQNGKVTAIQILKQGKNLRDPLIEPIKISIQPPPGYINNDLYIQLIKEGVDPLEANEKAKGTSTLAYAEPIFTGETLTGIKIINGGSGYSTTNPPGVAVPYIARKFVTVSAESTTAKIKEPGTSEMFQRSELFKTLANTSYEQTSYSWDESKPTKLQTPVADANGIFTGKYKFDISKAKKTTTPKRGYSFDDYSKDKTNEYSEKSTFQLEGSVKTLDRKKNGQIYVRDKVGITKEAAQAFLPPSNKNRSTTKNKDYTSLLSNISKQVNTNTQYFKKFSTNQKSLIQTGTVDATVYSSVSSQLEPDQRRQLSTMSSTVPLEPGYTSTSVDPPSDPESTSTINEAKSINLKVNNLDTGSYYSKEFKDFLVGIHGPNYSKRTISSLDDVDKKFEDNINSMWQMDLDENRTFIYDGAAASKVKYGFFNLPCSTRQKKYLVQSYCPDPRKNTFMRINVGVKVLGKNKNNRRGPCTQCLYDNATVLAAYNNLVNQYGSGNVDIADAYCSTYTFTTNYSGQSDGVPRGIPYGSYTLPYSSTLFAGFGRSYVKTQFANQYVYEGCRNYEFSGDLEILHDRTLETQVFVQAVNRYGNPYDFICSNSYEDRPSIDEGTINNIMSASSVTLSGATSQLSNPTLYSE